MRALRDGVRCDSDSVAGLDQRSGRTGSNSGGEPRRWYGALFDAVYTACRDKHAGLDWGQEPVRKAIILLSDGDDNQSRVYLSEAIKECQRSEDPDLLDQHQLDPRRRGAATR